MGNFKIPRGVNTLSSPSTPVLGRIEGVNIGSRLSQAITDLSTRDYYEFGTKTFLALVIQPLNGHVPDIRSRRYLASKLESDRFERNSVRRFTSCLIRLLEVGHYALGDPGDKELFEGMFDFQTLNEFSDQAAAQKAFQLNLAFRDMHKVTATATNDNIPGVNYGDIVLVKVDNISQPIDVKLMKVVVKRAVDQIRFGTPDLELNPDLPDFVREEDAPTPPDRETPIDEIPVIAEPTDVPPVTTDSQRDYDPDPSIIELSDLMDIELDPPSPTGLDYRIILGAFDDELLVPAPEGYFPDRWYSYEGSAELEQRYNVASSIKFIAALAALRQLQSAGISIDGTATFNPPNGDLYTFEGNPGIRKIFEETLIRSDNIGYDLLSLIGSYDDINRNILSDEHYAANLKLNSAYAPDDFSALGFRNFFNQDNGIINLVDGEIRINLNFGSSRGEPRRQPTVRAIAEVMRQLVFQDLFKVNYGLTSENLNFIKDILNIPAGARPDRRTRDSLIGELGITDVYHKAGTSEEWKSDVAAFRVEEHKRNYVLAHFYKDHSPDTTSERHLKEFSDSLVKALEEDKFIYTPSTE